MLGQAKFKHTISKLAGENTFPRFLVIQGPRGQGKKTAVKYISEILRYPIYKPEDLKVDSIRKVIEDSQSLQKPRIYELSDSHEMTFQAQNALLKLAEEPSRNAYIILTTENLYGLLPTIRSRAKVITLDPYSKQELSEFTDEKELVQICFNPGQIAAMLSLNWKEVISLADKIITSISSISAVNTLNIYKHIEQKVGADNLEMFYDILIQGYGEKLKEGKAVYGEIALLYQRKPLLMNKSINKKNLLEMLFIDLREVAICNSSN